MLMKEMLTEAYASTAKITGVDPSKPGNIKGLLVNDDAFGVYVDALSEGLDASDLAGFKTLSENTRINLLENSMFQVNPYESLTLPVMRVFYPRLIAKEAVTVSPMDKPECVRPVLKASFEKHGDPNSYQAPSINEDISGGPAIGTPVAAVMAVPSTNFDVLNEVGITAAEAHLERDFMITAVSADGTTFTEVSIVPAVEGHFSDTVTVGGSDDVVSGMVDYLAGTVSLSSTAGVVNFVRYSVTCSLEENMVNPKVKLIVDKIRLYAKDRQISANWSIHMEQDMKALFDVSLQAEIVNVLGQQIALDIDREIINNLLTANARLNPATHTRTFNASTPPAGYNWGIKYWHENIISDMNKLSAQIYTDTNMAAGNTVLANPLDVSVLEDINTFRYNGTAEDGGDLGYRSATVAGGKWKVLTSAVVPQGKMLMVYKPVEEIRAVYVYSPYVPVVMSPYPLGATPSLTILSRSAQAMIRSLGVAVLNIT